MAEQPTSDGRAFLARAFTHFCIMEWGYSPAEIEAGLEASGDVDWDVAERVLLAARELGKVFLRGDVETFARPFGGGAPTRLAKTVWELDDFRLRFARSAINAGKPFDAEAELTHWLFVDSAQFDVVLGRCEEPVRSPVFDAQSTGCVTPADVPPEQVTDRFLRLPEVRAAVGMSRSTIYERMKMGRFPRSVLLGGNLVAWREAEVREWMRSQPTSSLR